MKKEIFLSAVTALLAFLGALGGTFASAYLSDRQFNRQFNLERRHQLLEKRISLLEECVRSRAGMIRANMIMGLVDVEKLRIAAAIASRGKRRAELESVETGVNDLDLQQEYFGLLTNYTVCQQMSGLYFGPKTRAALSSLSAVEPWYSATNSDAMSAFIKAMHEELQYFPEAP